MGSVTGNALVERTRRTEVPLRAPPQVSQHAGAETIGDHAKGRTWPPRMAPTRPRSSSSSTTAVTSRRPGPRLILASTAGAMEMETSVFVTFWGLQTFVKDKKRITGENWMQKMMSFMQRPGVSHRKLSKMNFMGMGPWMMFQLAKKYNVAKPKELLEMAQTVGVKFLPCQMTMDMFGLKREDLIDGMGEPVGAGHGPPADDRRGLHALHLARLALSR